MQDENKEGICKESIILAASLDSSSIFRGTPFR